MHVLRGRNVNDLYGLGRALLDQEGNLQHTRAGLVKVVSSPVMSIYEKPMERVLFDAARDANPVFHVMEALWMLAGRADGTWLDQFVGDFSSRFAEDNGEIWGAYGRRWRRWFETKGHYLDQLSVIIQMLRRNPSDRRVVLSMWDPGYDLGADRRDVPCNTQIYPRVIEGKLDLTLMCRSNDIIWGAYGANAVHFSILHEYMAAMIGAQVGTFYQLSNNFHAYVDVLEKTPAPPVGDANPYFVRSPVYTMPMVTDVEHFDEDLFHFISEPEDVSFSYRNAWFDHVAVPMFMSYAARRAKDKTAALKWAYQIAAPDWAKATLMWMERRKW